MRDILAKLEAGDVLQRSEINQIAEWKAAADALARRKNAERSRLKRFRNVSRKKPNEINGCETFHVEDTSYLSSRLQPISPRAETFQKRFTYAVEFERLWAVYPLHNDKRAAHKKWLTVLKQGRATNEQLIAGAERYANDPNRDQQFTKLLATWLNGDCWTNGPLPERKAHHGKRQFIP